MKFFTHSLLLLSILLEAFLRLIKLRIVLIGIILTTIYEILFLNWTLWGLFTPCRLISHPVILLSSVYISKSIFISLSQTSTTFHIIIKSPLLIIQILWLFLTLMLVLRRNISTLIITLLLSKALLFGCVGGIFAGVVCAHVWERGIGSLIALNWSLSLILRDLLLVLFLLILGILLHFI